MQYCNIMVNIDGKVWWCRRIIVSLHRTKQFYIVITLNTYFMALRLKALFTDNEHYADSPLPYSSALARTVNEYILNDKSNCWPKEIRLYDLMSIVTLFISDSAKKTGFEDVVLKEHIDNMSQDVDNPFGSFSLVREPHNKCIVITDLDDYYIMRMLWATYVYFLFIKETSALETLHKVMHQINNSIPVDHTDRSHPLLKKAVDAANYMHQLCQNEQSVRNAANTNTAPPATSPNADEETTKLKARIAELEDVIRENNAKIQEQNAEIQSKQKTIEEQEAELAEWKTPAEEINANQKVRMKLLMMLMESDGMQFQEKVHDGKKKTAAEIMNAITGIPTKTCQTFLSDPNALNTSAPENEGTVIKLNTKLHALSMQSQL